MLDFDRNRDRIAVVFDQAAAAGLQALFRVSKLTLAGCPIAGGT
jgi:hypothetical protein